MASYDVAGNEAGPTAGGVQAGDERLRGLHGAPRGRGAHRHSPRLALGAYTRPLFGST